ncbi:uncharacterized protein AB675_6036 [Cyphellophora attinorum]|uniref:BTB domain-containing protein n=1 Tax=Cyphellophora attinorum TaxID=1664694 RepID=A0A0N1HP23_9EURO|nr:uncharacterized protein AB675_6036 [Phialophora attinorum]KPI36916.1 hypothetical protein AB675_6036 [Phialophora attinorum]
MVQLDEEQTVDVLKTGKYSDFTIKCGDKSFAVHKVVIASHSDFFRAAIESGFKEATENEIIIRESTCVAVAMVITFLYFLTNDDYSGLQTNRYMALRRQFYKAFRDKFKEKEWKKNTAFGDALDTYLLADRYMLTELKEAADEEIGHWLEYQWHNPLTLQASVEKIFTATSSTDNHVRPNLTVWIISHTCIVQRILGLPISLKPLQNYDKILGLGETHDPEGMRTGIRLLKRLHRSQLSSAEMTEPTITEEENRWR